MAFLKQTDVKEIVKQALESVADFSGDIENFEFKSFQDYHKKVFGTKLKEIINSQPYKDRRGDIDPERYYDIPLSMGIMNTWIIVKNCIDFVYNNQRVMKKDPNKIQL